MFVTRVLGLVHSGFGFPLAGGSGKSSSLVYETSNPRDKHVGELFSATACSMAILPQFVSSSMMDYYVHKTVHWILLYDAQRETALATRGQ
jgi:hypothetical protein